MTSNVDQDYQKEESLFDFLYLDRAKIASYSAQMFDDGNHLHTKKTAAISAQLGSNTNGGIPGFFKGAVSSSESNNETIERQFDATWSAPLNLLRELNEQGFCKEFTQEAPLGGLVFFKGNMQIIDLRILQKLWQPIMDMQLALKPAHTETQRRSKKAEEMQNKAVAKVAENLPHIIQMRIFNEFHQLWATLTPEALTINPSDLAFKYGPSMPGEWAVLGVIDAKPDGVDNIKLPVGIGEIEAGMLQMSLQLKQFFGRNSLDYGITPLAIYREIKR